MLAYKKILIVISGSIASYKSLDLISKLKKQKIEVDVIMTDGAKRFITSASVEGLSGKRVFDDLFEDGKMMDHIYLTRNYDLFLVYPASADFIAKVAQGRALDLATTTLLALNFKKPFWLAPAMNPSMYAHPATQENIKKLKKWGVKIIGPNKGLMACGDQGIGRLVEPLEIMELIKDESLNHFRAN